MYMHWQKAEFLQRFFLTPTLHHVIKLLKVFKACAAAFIKSWYYTDL